MRKFQFIIEMLNGSGGSMVLNPGNRSPENPGLDASTRSPHLRRRPVFHRAYGGAPRHVALLCSRGSVTGRTAL